MEHEEMEDELVNYYTNLLSEPILDRSQAINKITQHIPNLITHEQNEALMRPISMEEVVGFLYLYKLASIERKCLFTGRVDLSFWVVRTTLIFLGVDFLICILQLGFDQSAKGDLVNYNSRHDQSTKGD
jgi:hypothetical protein